MGGLGYVDWKMGDEIILGGARLRKGLNEKLEEERSIRTLHVNTNWKRYEETS